LDNLNKETLKISIYNHKNINIGKFKEDSMTSNGYINISLKPIMDYQYPQFLPKPK
jgi:hypothetical protein